MEMAFGIILILVAILEIALIVLIVQRGESEASRPSTLALGRLEFARVGEGRAAARRAGGGHRLAVDGDRIVHAAHHEVAGDGPTERGADRSHLLEDLLGARRPGRPGRLGLADALPARSWPSRPAGDRAGSCPRGR